MADDVVKAVNEHAALVAVAEAAASANVDLHILPDALHVALQNLTAVRAGQPLPPIPKNVGGAK